MATSVEMTGGLFLSGLVTGTVDLGGSILTSAGGNDAFLARFDSFGNAVWSQRFGGSSTDRALALLTGPSFVAIGGDLRSASVDFGGGPFASAGGAEGFFAEFDLAGAPLTSYLVASGPPNTVHSVTVKAVGVPLQGGRVTGGDFSGTADFGEGPVTVPHYWDAFIEYRAP